MARFTVILPEGSVLLKNTETGEILTLSAKSGPLTLGELEMTLTLAPAPLGAERETSAEKAPPTSTEEWIRPVPPGFGPNTELPFLSPKEELSVNEHRPNRPFIRVLDAPMDALVLEDFERTIETLAQQRNNMEGEIEFLEEIDADDFDIMEIKKEIENIDFIIGEIINRRKLFEG